jgi:endonuclease III
LEERVPPELRYRLHVAFIRHGRAVCKAPRPKCEICNLTDLCGFARSRPVEAS